MILRALWAERLTLNKLCAPKCESSHEYRIGAEVCNLQRPAISHFDLACCCHYTQAPTGASAFTECCGGFARKLQLSNLMAERSYG